MIDRILKVFGFSGTVRRGSAIHDELTALEREFLPPLLEIQESPPSPVKRKVAISIIGFVFVMILWAYIGKIDVVSTSEGKFIPDGKVKVVQPMENATVRAIYVKEGQHVKKGDLLVSLDSTISSAELASNEEKLALSQLDQARLQAELHHANPSFKSSSPELIALQESLLKSRRASYEAKLDQAEQILKEKTAQLESGEAVLKKLRQENIILSEKEESARPLVKSGAVSRIDYLQLKQDLISNEYGIKAQIKNVEEYRHAMREAEVRVVEVKQSDRSGILSDLDSNAAVLADRQGNVIKSKRIVEQQMLVSPVDGVVQTVNVSTIGGVVTPSQPLVVIVPKDTPLIVEATLSNEDVGFVRVGQRVDIKLDAFPFQKYGTLRGVLTWISPDAEETTVASNTPDTSTQSQQQGGGRGKVSYKVHVRPDRQSIKADGRVVLIAPGMTVEADIVTEKRRVIDFFLSPVSRYLNEGLEVR